MLVGLATLGDRRPLGAAPGCRRDRRPHRAQARPGGRGRAAADPVRRRAARGARGGPAGGGRRRPSCAGAPRPGRRPTGARRDGRPRHRLRAGLGDRDGPQRARRPTRRRWPTRSGPTLARRSAAAPRAARRLPVLYGGSVTAADIGEFLAEPAIDGALVGGASLKPDEMAGIVGPGRADAPPGRDAVAARDRARARDADPRPAPPRRERLEPGEPLHRLDRRRPLRDGRWPRPTRPAGCCREGGFDVRHRLHLGAQAGDPDPLDRPRRAGPDVAAGRAHRGGSTSATTARCRG